MGVPSLNKTYKCGDNTVPSLLISFFFRIILFLFLSQTTYSCDPFIKERLGLNEQKDTGFWSRIFKACKRVTEVHQVLNFLSAGTILVFFGCPLPSHHTAPCRQTQAIQHLTCRLKIPCHLGCPVSC